MTGRLSVAYFETPGRRCNRKAERMLLDGLVVESVKHTDNIHFSAILSSAELHFSRFAFDLLAMMQGTYEVGRLSSLWRRTLRPWSTDW